MAKTAVKKNKAAAPRKTAAKKTGASSSPVKKAAKAAKKATPKTAKPPTPKSSTVQGTLFEPPAEEKNLAEAAEVADLLEMEEEESAPKKKSAKKKDTYATAETMAKSQRSISVSEFFAKNRHLLGFDNPRKALLTTVKEAVDNSLDACEEAGILPEVRIEIQQLAETHFKVCVQDNGPGIVKKQIPSIFGQLLYGSKFHRLRMSRGQQGIGISAAGMYGLLTTGRPISIISRTSSRTKAHHYELQIDTKLNRPDIVTDQAVDWDFPHGTKVELELEARYQRGRQSVDDYLQQTAIANPHVTIIYHAPDGREETYAASVKELPAIPKSIRPHPHGIELGVMIKMLQDTKASNIKEFLTTEFSRISPRVAEEIIEKSNVRKNARTQSLNGVDAKKIYHVLQEVKILAPATDCVVPIGEEQLLSGLRQVVSAEFYTASTRRPAVYRGNPFIIEAAIAYGKPENRTEEDPRDDESAPEETSPDSPEDDEKSLAKVIRFANRVPLQYQQGACAITKAVMSMNWRGYGLSQSRGALPAGDLTIAIHMASVWVPFTSESKEAIAPYPEVLKEIRLALQDCGRKLGSHIRKGIRLRQELKKRGYIEKYIPAIGEALRDILDLKEKQVNQVCEDLKDVLERSRKL